MTITVDQIVERFTHPSIPKIGGQPSYHLLKELFTTLNANAASVPCTLGWIAVTISPALYTTLTTPLLYLEARWLPSLHDFLAHIGARFILDQTYIAPCQREHDRYVIQQVVSSEVFTAHELHIINCCRLYLNVLTNSDLTHACGFTLDPLSSNTNLLLPAPRITTRPINLVHRIGNSGILSFSYGLTMMVTPTALLAIGYTLAISFA
jgi:hypothetical protein